MNSAIPDDLPGRMSRGLQVLHSMIYFAPEAAEEFAAIGLAEGRLQYFAGRSAAMGAVGPGPVAATFYNFNPDLIARSIPLAWTLAAPSDVLAARWRAADRAMRRLLGAEVDGPAVRQAADLARAATAELRPPGRPLFAAHADLSWPQDPHLVLWHACTLLREYRGDGHLTALLAGELSGIEAIVTHTATGRGFTEQAAKKLRGWSDEQWHLAVDGLVGRGLMSGAQLTPAGVALRDSIEKQTDRLDVTACRTLGVERATQLLELGQTLSRTMLDNGAFPDGVFATRR